jgi:hypothetical protein
MGSQAYDGLAAVSTTARVWRRDYFWETLTAGDAATSVRTFASDILPLRASRHRRRDQRHEGEALLDGDHRFRRGYAGVRPERGPRRHAASTRVRQGARPPAGVAPVTDCHTHVGEPDAHLGGEFMADADGRDDPRRALGAYAGRRARSRPGIRCTRRRLRRPERLRRVVRLAAQ